MYIIFISFIIFSSLLLYGFFNKRRAINSKTWIRSTLFIAVVLSIVYAFTISNIINALQGASPVDATPIEMLEAHHIGRIEETIALLEFSEFITHFSVQEFEESHTALQRRYSLGYYNEEYFVQIRPPNRRLAISVTVYVQEETAIGGMRLAKNSPSGFQYTVFVFDNGVEAILNQPFMPVGSLRIPNDNRVIVSHVRFGNTIVRLDEYRLRNDTRDDISSHFISYLVEMMLEQDNH